MATKKKAAKKNKGAKKKSSAKKKNKLGVKNSLVNNINARKKKGKSRSKKKSTISKESYKDMQKKMELNQVTKPAITHGKAEENNPFADLGTLYIVYVTKVTVRIGNKVHLAA